MSDSYPLAFVGAYPVLAMQADFKSTPEDFQVSEVLGFTPSGSGEHVFLHIEKIGLTTESLVLNVARALNVKARDIGLCGLKDKHAVTTQWLSVPLPIKAEIPQISGSNWRVLEATRHTRKLKRGIHKANQFVIVLRNVTASRELLEQRLMLISAAGVLNYFGMQRFGYDGGNLE